MGIKRDDPASSAMATCPSCDTNIRLRGKLQIGQMITCPECGDVLEVIQLNPFKLDWAFEEPFDEEEEGIFDEEEMLDEEDEFDDFEDFEDAEDSFYDDDFDDDDYRPRSGRSRR